jgi:hypothetical protein
MCRHLPGSEGEDHVRLLTGRGLDYDLCCPACDRAYINAHHHQAKYPLRADLNWKDPFGSVPLRTRRNGCSARPVRSVTPWVAGEV